MKKPTDPLERWRGVDGCLFFSVPCPEDVSGEVATRWDGRQFPTWRCVKALAGRGAVDIVYFTQDKAIYEQFSSPRSWGWPMDLIAQAHDTVNDIWNARAEQAEIQRKEAGFAEQMARREAEAARWK